MGGLACWVIYNSSWYAAEHTGLLQDVLGWWKIIFFKMFMDIICISRSIVCQIKVNTIRIAYVIKNKFLQHDRHFARRVHLHTLPKSIEILQNLFPCYHRPFHKPVYPANLSIFVPSTQGTSCLSLQTLGNFNDNYTKEYVLRFRWNKYLPNWQLTIKIGKYE